MTMDLINKLNYLFGDEEHVGYRKQLVILREKICALAFKNDARFVCSGSLGEGVDYPRSDDDLMIYSIDPSTLVRTTYEEVMLRGGVLMVPSEYSPGFCTLQVIRNYTGTGVVQIHGSRFISSVLFRDRFLLPGLQPHGPCISFTMDEFFEFDLAHCLHCRQWPYIADEWISRVRPSGWLPRRLIEEIVNGGCHVVPIGNPDSPLCDLEWRVSFSVAERTLIHSFNHVQFLIYNLMKLVLKRIIIVRVPDALCSYFLKTVMFYVIENTTDDVWVPERIEECYNKALLLLYQFIDRMNCPNYFIPDNNMMRRKVNAHNRPLLLSVIRELMSHGIMGSLHLCGESYVATQQLTQREIEWKGDRDLLCGYLWEKTITETSILFNNKFFNVGEILSDLRKLVVLDRRSHAHAHVPGSFGVTKALLKKICTYAGLTYLQMTQFCSNNKEKLRVLNIGRSLLRRGCGSDVSSGRLHLATFFYMTGRFHDCLLIINDVLSKYSPHVMNDSKEKRNFPASEMYMTHICGNGYSLDYKMKIAWALDLELYVKYAHGYPVPVRIILLLIDRDIGICSLVYSYVLQGLCFYQTDNNDSFRNSISVLEDILKDLKMSDLEIDKLDSFFGRILVGYMRMLQHDYHSAIRCFTLAYLIDSPGFRILKTTKRVPLFFIACVLNRTIYM